MSRRPSAVRWLTAQALVFGFTAVLLAVIAYALFLDAYGSRWLPVAYVGIAGAGQVIQAFDRLAYDFLALAQFQQ